MCTELALEVNGADTHKVRGSMPFGCLRRNKGRYSVFLNVFNGEYVECVYRGNYEKFSARNGIFYLLSSKGSVISALASALLFPY